MKNGGSQARIRVRFAESRTFLAISLIAALLTIVGFALTFDPIKRVVFGRDVNLQWTVTNEVPVFDIRNPLPELTVTYQGENLTRSDRTIVVSTVQLTNSGNEPVGPDRLTDLDPLGLRISGGTLVRVLAVNASSPHLREHLSTVQQGNVIIFRRGIIIDPSDTVTLSLLIRKQPSTALHYTAIGKVGGQNDIRFSAIKDSPSQSFINDVFGGSLLVLLARLVAYFLTGVFLIIALIFVSEKVSDFREAKRTRGRKSISIELASGAKDQDSSETLFVRLLYENLGLRGLVKLRSMKSHPDENRKEYERVKALLAKGQFKKKDGETEEAYLMRMVSDARGTLWFVAAGEELGYFNMEKRTSRKTTNEELDRFIDTLSTGPKAKKVQRLEPRGSEPTMILDDPRYLEYIQSRGLITERFIIESSDTNIPAAKGSSRS